MYGPKAKLLMTDTDSLMYEIQTEDFFEDIRKYIKLFFDTSNIENSKLPRINKNVPGKFNSLASVRFRGFSEKKTPKCTWLCAGISPVRFALQTW